MESYLVVVLAVAWTALALIGVLAALAISKLFYDDFIAPHVDKPKP